MDRIIVITKLSQDEYTWLNYYLTYRKFSMKFSIGFGLFLMLGSFMLYQNTDQFPWVGFVFGFMVVVYIPVQLYFVSKKTYTLSKLSESILYEFDDENIRISGKTFSIVLSWTGIYSVTENYNWVLIWQNQYIANVIMKRDFKEGDYEKFQKIVSLYRT
jgi:hypothetical protein